MVYRVLRCILLQSWCVHGLEEIVAVVNWLILKVLDDLLALLLFQFRSLVHDILLVDAPQLGDFSKDCRKFMLSDSLGHSSNKLLKLRILGFNGIVEEHGLLLSLDPTLLG